MFHADFADNYFIRITNSGQVLFTDNSLSLYNLAKDSSLGSCLGTFLRKVPTAVSQCIIKSMLV